MIKAYPVITAHGISDTDCSSPTHVSLIKLQAWLQDCIRNQVHFETLETVKSSEIKSAACLTFDDALSSIMKVVENLPSPGTIFVVSDYVGKLNRWNGQPSWVTEENCLSWSQIKELNLQGWCIGAHSCSHPDFNKCPTKQIRNEIETSKKTIEDQIGQKCSHFAYPYGIAPRIAQEIVEEYKMVGYGTEPGWVGPRDPLKCLPRIDVYDLVRSGMASDWAWSEPGQMDLQIMKYKRWVGSGLRNIRRIAS
jgi:peptidoglycan/xylan/chitin deacetylase (PgdA/CDA1 family)